jgi:hypothetical protein
MAKAKPKSNLFTGRWRIISKSAWEQDFIDEEVEGYIEFGDKDQGEFYFGYVHDQMDCRRITRDSRQAADWIRAVCHQPTSSDSELVAAEAAELELTLGSRL